MEPYWKRVRCENSRYLSQQKHGAGQQGVVWRHWKCQRRLLTSERGAWAYKYGNLQSLPPTPSTLVFRQQFAFT